MSSTVERHEMPSGAVLYYRDKPDHSYWERHLGDKCSGRIPGISTASKCDGSTSNDALIDWGVRLDRAGTAREAALGLSLDDVDDMRAALSWLESGEAIGQTLKEERLTWRHIREEAGTRGAISHGVLEALAAGRTPEPQSPYDEAVIGFWNDAQPEPLNVEQVVYSPTLNVAGRFDLRARINGEVVLADLKTGGFAANAWAIQLNLYRICLREAGFGDVDRLAVIQVTETGTYRELKIPVNEKWALDSLATYNNGKQIGAAIREAKKQAELDPVAA